MVSDHPKFGKQVSLKTTCILSHHKLLTCVSALIIKKGGEKFPLTIFAVCLIGMSLLPDGKKTPLYKVMYVVGYPPGGTVDTAENECTLNA